MGTNISGKVQGVSLDSFLQMAQMESLTCTLTVTAGGNVGYLYLLDGELVSAKAGDLKNIDAAHQIISWEKAVIEMDEACDKTRNEINLPLMNILMEGVKLRDEHKKSPPPQKEATQSQDTSENDARESVPPKKESPVAEKKPASPSPKPVSDKSIPPPVKPKPPSEPKKPVLKYIVVGLILFLIIGGLSGACMIFTRQARMTYESLLVAVNNADTQEQKLALLKNYLGTEPGETYANEAKKQISEIQKQIESNDFSILEKTIKKYISSGAFEEAMAAYDNFLELIPTGSYTNTIKTRKKELIDLIETRAFETMLDRTAKQGPERIDSYKDFLAQHPKGKHRKEVLKLISGMQDEYFIYIERRILEMEQSGNWPQCFDLSQQYIDEYPDSDHAKMLEKYQQKCKTNIQANTIFAQLQERAQFPGTDLKTALMIYTDHLLAYPHSPAKDKIDVEIKRLKELAEIERRSDAIQKMKRLLSENNSRDLVIETETVKDKKTGLTWCLLDSQLDLNECITYDGALAYVDALKTGGYTDWELPAPSELTRLFSTTSPFPPTGAQWYWTSKSSKRFIGQWVIDVEVVAPAQDGDKDSHQKESWECGAVWAVRKSNPD